MILPSFKRIISTDFGKEYKKLLDQLALILNNGIEVVYNALANNITLRDNISSTIKDVLVTVDASGKPVQTSAFKLDRSTKVEGLIVISAVNQTNSSVYPVNGVFVSGVQGAGVYTISNITGLQAGQSYLIRVVAFHS